MCHQFPLSRLTLPLAALAVLLQGCSASGEDPRINLCRSLAADLSGTSENQWSSAGNRFVRPEYAVVEVSAGAAGKAACFYEYDLVEESAVDHANPLLAYATLPYRMTLDGVQVAEPTLKAAVTMYQKESPAKVLEEARKVVEQAGEQMRRSVEAVQNR